MKIVNKKELDEWLSEQVNTNKDVVVAIKGIPPEGALYSDGSPVTHPINIGWQNTRTGEVFYLMYDFECNFKSAKVETNKYEHLRKDNS